jgi:D-lactate dehydrogenase (cytochrome)
MKTITGKDNVQAEAAQILSDESRYTAGIPERVYYPETFDDLRAAVAEAGANGRPLTIIGGQTGITGSSVPTDGSFALCLEKMNRILAVEFDQDDRPILLCQPGVTLQQIAAFCDAPLTDDSLVPGSGRLTPGAWFYPPDPTEMSCQLGGSVATNASGARSFRFGPTRGHVASARLILADGATLNLRRGQSMFTAERCEFSTEQGTRVALPAIGYRSPQVKNAAGYHCSPPMDLLDLFIGSEGTLGIFAEIGIRLSPARPILSGLSFFADRQGAFAAADWLRADPAVIAIEYFDQTSLGFIRRHQDAISLQLPEFPATARTAIFWEYLEPAPGAFEERMEQWEEALCGFGSSFDLTWSGFEADERQRLKTFRHAVPELVNFRIARLKASCPQLRKIGTDAAVPAGHFRAFFDQSVNLLESQNLPHVIFGHLGDHHLHMNILPETSEQLEQALKVYSQIMDLAIGCGGTVSAEHGIGKLKREYLRKMVGDGAIDEMKRIKAALDPQWRLNPGNLFERS